MFFSILLVVQFAILWSLISLIAHENQHSSLAMTAKILAVYVIAKVSLRLLVAFQFPEVHWMVTMSIGFALLYFLIWKVTGTSHKTSVAIWLSFVAASVAVETFFGLF
jgi:hypothetical protein